MSTENMVYFAVCGQRIPELPPHSSPAYGGFGFYPDGTLRIPYAPPANAVVIFDDAQLPCRSSGEALCQFVTQYRPDTVLFDFERNETSFKDCLINAVPCSKLLAQPYHPKAPLSVYLRKIKQADNLIPVITPMRFVLSNGLWHEDTSQPERGCYSDRHRCMYCTRRMSGGTEIHFFDTKQTILRRAASIGMPSVMPLDDYKSLK